MTQAGRQDANPSAKETFLTAPDAPFRTVFVDATKSANDVRVFRGQAVNTPGQLETVTAGTAIAFPVPDVDAVTFQVDPAGTDVSPGTVYWAASDSAAMSLTLSSLTIDTSGGPVDISGAVTLGAGSTVAIDTSGGAVEVSGTMALAAGTAVGIAGTAQVAGAVDANVTNAITIDTSGGAVDVSGPVTINNGTSSPGYVEAAVGSYDSASAINAASYDVPSDGKVFPWGSPGPAGQVSHVHFACITAAGAALTFFNGTGGLDTQVANSDGFLVFDLDFGAGITSQTFGIGTPAGGAAQTLTNCGGYALQPGVAAPATATVQ